MNLFFCIVFFGFLFTAPLDMQVRGGGDVRARVLSADEQSGLRLPVSGMFADTLNAAAIDTLNATLTDTADVMAADEDVADEVEEQDTTQVATPLRINTPAQWNPAWSESMNDSLARWELWSHFGERLSRQAGVVSMQQGGHGRNDAFLIQAYQSRHQRISQDGIPRNERIFGSVNRNRLMHYSRMATAQSAVSHLNHETEIYRRRYYLSHPLTFINYEQTAYNYRSTEALISQNVNPSTNITLAYWGKNQNEGYRRNDMGGRNAEILLTHHLNEYWVVEGGYEYSGLQLSEHDGYNIADMTGFSFNRFEAMPNQSAAASSVRNSLFRINAWHRSSEQQAATSRLAFYHDRYRRSYYQTVDSSFVLAATTGLSARHVQRLGPLTLQGDLLSEWTLISEDRHSSLPRGSWLYNRARITGAVALPASATLTAWAQAGVRTDRFSDYETGVHVHVPLPGGLQAYGSLAAGTLMPQPGHVYWNRAAVYGNNRLMPELLQRVQAGMRYSHGSWQADINLHAGNTGRGILVGRDTTFVQAGDYLSMGASGRIAYESRRIEAVLSGTFHQYVSDDIRFENRLLDLSGQRVITRMSFHYMNYAFNRAAFFKGGFYVLVSPSAYRASRYYPEMDYWDPNGWNPYSDLDEAQAIPQIVRLDLDLTARVRSAIFLFRLENALDNILLPGYFETAYQPMPSMRYRFGIRWILRN